MRRVRRQPSRTPVPTPYWAVVGLLRPPILALTKRDWSGGEHLPRQGGFVVAANHISEVDPFMLAHFLVDHGTPPVFLAKSSLFRLPLLGRTLRALGQVPVERGTVHASTALGAAEDAVRAGSCVAIMPEGTLTRDPGLWPMRAKTGVARVALATGAPVIPVAQWGPQALLAPYARVPRFARVTMQVRAGPPVDLDDLRGLPLTPARLREATDRVMADITAILGDLRGEEPPSRTVDPATPEAGA